MDEIKSTVENTFYISKNPIESEYFRNTKSINKIISKLQHYDEIEFDTETTGLFFLKSDIILYQFGVDGLRFIINNNDFPISLFKDILENKTLIIHNAKFDIKFLYKYDIVPTSVYDTMLAEKVIYTGTFKSVSLANTIWRRLNLSMDKSVRDNFGRVKLNEEMIVYAADDVTYLSKVKELQKLDINANNLNNTVELENKFVLVLAYIEFCGMGFNLDMWRDKCKEDHAKYLSIRDELNKEVINLNNPEFVFNGLFGIEVLVDWASPKQVARLFKTLGLNTSVIDKKTGNAKDSVLSTVIESQKHIHKIVPIYLEYKKVEKLVTSFGNSYEEFYDEKTGRIYTEFKQILDTGRISSGGKGKDRDYPNVQQVPSDKRHRGCFRAAPGNKMIVADYSSQESRILVDISKDPVLLDFYLSGGADLHSYTAKLVYDYLKDVNIDSIKDLYKAERSLMKTVNFGLAYGASASTISRNANIPMDKAEEVYNNYFKVFKGLEAYFDKAKRFPVENGYVLINNVTNRKSYIDAFEDFVNLDKTVNNREFWTLYRENKTEERVQKVREYFKLKGIIERKGLNFVIQGTAADMSKLAGCMMFKYLRENKLLFKVFMPNIVHDELHLECPESISENMSIVLKKCMEDAGSVFCKTIPIVAEVDIDDWWKK